MMEVKQQLHLVQVEAWTLFEEIEGQGSQLDQVVATVEQRLEGYVTEQVIQEFTEQVTLVKQQVEAARGLQHKVSQIKVTQDESQVSVGGMLALDQVLWKHWSCLTIFGTSIGWSKMELPGEVEIMGSLPFCRNFGPLEFM
jgi:hypothetical protein